MLKKYEKASERVSIKGVLKAREAISHYVQPTNLIYYSELSRLIGCDAFVKHENHMPTGSFKIRGAINFFHTIPKENVENGVLVSTRGNHGLAMAWASRWFNVPCTVVVPENNNPETNRIIESFGTELIVHGKDFYDAQFYCDELVAAAGYYYVEQGNEPEMLNGIGTMGLEIFEDLSDVDVISVPSAEVRGVHLCSRWPRPSTRVSRSSGSRRRGQRHSISRSGRETGSSSTMRTPSPTGWRPGASSLCRTRS